jgi:hypothetical protein
MNTIMPGRVLKTHFLWPLLRSEIIIQVFKINERQSNRPDDGSNKLLYNFGQYLGYYTVQHPRRQPSSYSP